MVCLGSPVNRKVIDKVVIIIDDRGAGKQCELIIHAGAGGMIT